MSSFFGRASRCVQPLARSIACALAALLFTLFAGVGMEDARAEGHVYEHRDRDGNVRYTIERTERAPQLRDRLRRVPTAPQPTPPAAELDPLELRTGPEFGPEAPSADAPAPVSAGPAESTPSAEPKLPAPPPSAPSASAQAPEPPPLTQPLRAPEPPPVGEAPPLAPPAPAQAPVLPATESPEPAVVGANDPAPGLPLPPSAAQEEIAALEREIERDRELLKTLISESGATGASIASDPRVREIAERLPRRQAQLDALRRETGR